MSEKYVKSEEDSIFDEKEKNEILDNYYTLRNNIYTWKNPELRYAPQYPYINHYCREIKKSENENYCITVNPLKITKREKEKYYRIHVKDEVLLEEHFKDDLDFHSRVFFCDLSDDLLKLMNAIRKRKKIMEIHLTYQYLDQNKPNKKFKKIISFIREDMDKINERIQQRDECNCCIIL